MTESLYYIPGTMDITAENRAGDKRKLQIDEDYLLENRAAEHRLIITVLQPGEETYTLSYDARILIPQGSTNITYSNYASITLFGKQISSGSDSKVLTEVSSAAKSHSMVIKKVIDGTDAVLPGAEFGLYAVNGEKVAEGITDENGELRFQTDLEAGIILQEHSAFYLLEQKAPDGYLCSPTKYWFFFCDHEDVCSKDAALSEQYTDILRFTERDENDVTIGNRRSSYELPATGGPGYRPLTLGGTAIMLAAAAGGGLRRSRSRRRNRPQA